MYFLLVESGSGSKLECFDISTVKKTVLFKREEKIWKLIRLIAFGLFYSGLPSLKFVEILCFLQLLAFARSIRVYSYLHIRSRQVSEKILKISQLSQNS